METIREILGLDFLSLPFSDDNRKKYDANASGKRIGEVIIDGVKITGYSAFSFVRKLTYVKSPTRSADGSIGNLDSYPVFTTSQLQIDFSLLSIDMYRKIMNLIYARREHVVQCYDIVRDEQVTEKMYFEPEELPKLATIARQLQGETYSRVEILGVLDYVVTMVGTNMPNETININYYDYNNNIIASEQMVENTEMLIGEGVAVENISGYKFNNKWQRGYLENGVWQNFGEPYIDKQAYRVVLEKDYEKSSKSISFKAVYKDNQEYSLVLNYGLGDETKDDDGNPISTFTFTVGQTIGDIMKSMKLLSLPESPNPTIKIDGKTYETHNRNLGWFFTPVKSIGSTKISNGTIINIASDLAIYQLFEPVKHNIKLYNVVDGLALDYDTLEDIEYMSSVVLPKLRNDLYDGYEFLGWFFDRKFTKKFDGKMPPYDLDLYSKWEKKK